ncbi:phage head closure protein [Sporohalobacter salinus]|uniref:phage head closure protein n=1 Tax=Sporohalobacter salinus TaxID=1494606 RepID=UPI0019606ACB|nr:phage head closure protein [Sporohalobacter salinus]MBM7624779.1 SPP1 family predicted phage head-tail adaptor [Sporohalobacter salinus]
MRHNKVIYLPITTIEEDEFENEVEVISDWRRVYANKYSINSSEFYNAAKEGLRPELAFRIYDFEYDGEDKFKYNGDEYNIIRTQGSGEKMILVGEKVTADV